MLTVVPSSEQKEYTVAMPVHDVREFGPEAASGICTFGGFTGELILTLHLLQEHMKTKGEAPDFEIKADSIQKFMEELLMDGYPAGICFINVSADPLTETELAEETVEKQAEIAANRLSEGKSVSGHGIKFMLANSRALGLNEQMINDVLRSLCEIHYHQPQELIAIPDEADEPSEEAREKIAEQNEEIEKSNELFAKLKQFVQLVTPPAQEEGEGEEMQEPSTANEVEEKALVRIMNYREPVNTDVSGEPGTGVNTTTISKDHHVSGVVDADAKADAEVSETES